MAKRILVVDDDSDIVMAMEAAFKAWGFEVETVLNGIEATEVLQCTPVDGMILGTNMPYMDGYEVVRYIRGTNREMPLIVYSTRGACSA